MPPALSGKEPSIRLSFALPKSTHRKIIKAAKSEGMLKSEWIREQCEKGLNAK